MKTRWTRLGGRPYPRTAHATDVRGDALCGSVIARRVEDVLRLEEFDEPPTDGPVCPRCKTIVAMRSHR